jgi:hypothetical protein
VRQLSPEEAALWARVTATIQPLSRENIKREAAEKEQQYPDVMPLARQPKLRPIPAAAPVRPRLGTTLDASWDRRLRSGAAEPDRVLDLHGMTRSTAFSSRRLMPVTELSCSLPVIIGLANRRSSAAASAPPSTTGLPLRGTRRALQQFAVRTAAMAVGAACTSFSGADDFFLTPFL